MNIVSIDGKPLASEDEQAISESSIVDVFQIGLEIKPLLVTTLNTPKRSVDFEVSVLVADIIPGIIIADDHVEVLMKVIHEIASDNKELIMAAYLKNQVNPDVSKN